MKNGRVIKKDLFDAIEGYYAMSLMYLLHSNGIIDYNSGEINPNSRDKKIYFVLKFLRERTDIIIRSPSGKYYIAKKYRHYLHLGYHLEKIIGAYGNFKTKGKYGLVINKKSFAAAYHNADYYINSNFQQSILEKLGASHVLDLGCGYCNTLISFCSAGEKRKGIGIDLNPIICSEVKKKIRDLKLGKKIKILSGDASEFDKMLSGNEISGIDVIIGSNYFNEYFSSENTALRIFKKLKRHFPGRRLVILDYYSTWDTKESSLKVYQHNYIHDLIQLLSGQGLTPRDYNKWNTVYTKAGYILEEVMEGSSVGIKWFIHILRS